MTLSPAFLDEIRARTTLSNLVGRTVKIKKAGREYQGCCPFHQEKTPSFTVNDEKGFYHCFGCNAHGDAIRWLTDHGGMTFMDAVKELAAAAGLEMPARSPADAARADERDQLRPVLEASAAWFAQQLEASGAVMEYLAGRGIGPDLVKAFGLGFAPGKGSKHPVRLTPDLARFGIDALVASGMSISVDGKAPYDRFRDRIMIPIKDPRGRVIAFGGRIFGDGSPKYLNSPETALFDKGRVLFNLDRAAPAARARRRLLVVEGYMDVIGLAGVGIDEAVAPNGTALTDAQLDRAWQVHHCPIVMLDGDSAGQAAAWRACERAMPHLAPGKSLAIAVLPAGQDPDDMARSGGAEAIEAVIAQAQPLADFVFSVAAGAVKGTPEAIAGLWQRLSDLAAVIVDQETRDQYVSAWRTRFDAAFPQTRTPTYDRDDRTVPNGSVLIVSDKEGRQLQRIAAAQFDRAIAGGFSDAEAIERAAWRWGRRVAAGLIDEETVMLGLTSARLLQLEEAGGDAEAAALDALAQSFEAGKRDPFDPSAQILDLRCAGLPMTDLGNAERFRDRYGCDFRYTTAKGWLGWDGKRWKVLDQEKDATPAEVQAAVFSTVRSIQDEAAMIRATGSPHDANPDGLDVLIYPPKDGDLLSSKLSKYGRTSEGSGKLGCIANLAKRWLTAQITDFDLNPMILNCQNGTLHFHRGTSGQGASVTLEEHRREDMLTKLTAVDYDPEAACPLYDGVFKWAQPDKGMRRYLRQWAGYNLTGDMGAQIFHIWFGPLAANGKSTIGNAWREAMGDYGDAGNVQTFLDEGGSKRGDAATPDLVRLPGVRMLTAGEPPKGAKIDEALINTMTGGDPMLVRDNFRSFFQFVPLFKFTLWCNHRPAIPQGTAGIWRRVKVVPWGQHMPEDKRDGDLPRKLRAEYAGVLAWMVRGLIDWLDNGFIEPDAVKAASADYKDDSDPLASFLRLCTEPDPAGRVQSSHLYDLFCAWCKAAGENEWKQKGFSQAMKDKGFTNKASNGMQWLGLVTTKRVGDFIDHEGKVITLDVADQAPVAPAPLPDDGKLPEW